MMMKQNEIAGRVRPGFTGMAANQRANLGLWTVRSIAVCAIVTQCLNPAQAADALPAREPSDPAAQVPKPACSPQACQMKRYQAFVRQADMPAITATDKTTLEVGGTAKIDLKRLAQLSGTDREAIASQFGVPAGVTGRLLERASINLPPNATQLAQDLRTAVIDYKFLHGEWGRYNPPPEGKNIKAEALQALQAGDITKAWQLYDGLQKPQPPGIAPPPPPTNLRVVSQQ